jgi:hypothetical protein
MHVISRKKLRPPPGTPISKHRWTRGFASQQGDLEGSG